jgi:hypothetical protein
MFHLRNQEHGYLVFHGDMPIGNIYKEVDGYYVFNFTGGDGCYPQEFFFYVGEELMKLNQDWDDVLKKELV